MSEKEGKRSRSRSRVERFFFFPKKARLVLAEEKEACLLFLSSRSPLAAVSSVHPTPRALGEHRKRSQLLERGKKAGRKRPAFSLSLENENWRKEIQQWFRFARGKKDKASRPPSLSGERASAASKTSGELVSQKRRVSSSARVLEKASTVFQERQG
jgi:hypothetical protein